MRLKSMHFHQNDDETIGWQIYAYSGENCYQMHGECDTIEQAFTAAYNHQSKPKEQWHIFQIKG